MYLNTLRMGNESSSPNNNTFPRSKTMDEDDAEERGPSNVVDKIMGPKGIRKYQLCSMGLLLSAFAFMGIITVLVVEDVITFGYTASDLSDFPSQIKFVLRFQVLPIFWLFTSMKILMFRRLRSQAINPMSGNEDLVVVSKNVFTNSIEQAFMSMWIQFVLLAFLTPESLLKYIPLINIFHFIGRWMFFIGYPKYRSFGFALTMVPPTVALLTVLCKLIGICKDAN